MASIYPNIKNGKIVSFKFKAFLGRDAQGVQIVKCKTWKVESECSTKKLYNIARRESDIWEEQIIKAFNKNKELINLDKISFNEFAHNIWLKNQIKDKNQRVSTITQKKYLLETISSYLGNFKFKSITTPQLKKYFEYLKHDHISNKNKTYSPTTIKHIYRILNSIYKFAVNNNYLLENPLSTIETPKINRHKVDALSKNEVRTFLSELEKLPLKQQVMYNLLLTTGIRRGELFGLKWKDFDFNNRLVKIQRNVTYTKDSGTIVGLPKTEMSIRTIPLTDKTLSLLKEYCKIDIKNKKLSGNEFLFHTEKSYFTPQNPTTLTRRLKAFVKKINLPDTSPHDLRHTCGSLLVQGGTDIKSVQDILGHSDASTTLNYYVRSDIEKIRNATQRVFNF